MQVGLTGPLRSAAGGAAELAIEAKTIRELLNRLIEQYPDMSIHMDLGIAVSVDGVMYRDDWDVEIPGGVEVVLLPRIQGG